MTKLKLYGAPLSPFVRKVRIVFAMKKLDYDYDPSITPGNMPDWYVAKHPLKRIPTLTIGEGDGALELPDSSVICAWGEHEVPEPPVYRRDIKEFCKVLWLEEFSDTGLAEALGLGVFRPILFNMLAKKEPDLEAAQKGLARVRKRLAYLETQLAPSGFLVGDTWSLADIAVCAQLINLEHVGYKIQESDGAGMLALYRRFLELPEVKPLAEQDGKVLEMLGFSAPTWP